MKFEAHQPSPSPQSGSTQDPGQVLDFSLEGEGNGHHQAVKEEGATVASNDATRVDRPVDTGVQQDTGLTGENLRKRLEQLQLVLLEEIHHDLHDMRSKIYAVSQKLAALRDSLLGTNVSLQAIDELHTELFGREA